MPWQDPKVIPFSRILIAAEVPSNSGIYAIFDGDLCVFVGESWNLKARLLALANVLADASDYTVVYETCSDEDRLQRHIRLSAEFLPGPEILTSPQGPPRDLGDRAAKPVLDRFVPSD
jgi:hypothetical protein